MRITNVKLWSAEKTLWSVDVNTYIIVISKKGEPKKCLSWNFFKNKIKNVRRHSFPFRAFFVRLPKPFWKQVSQSIVIKKHSLLWISEKKNNMKNEKKKPERKHFYPALPRFVEFYSNFKLKKWNGCCILKGKLLSTLSRLVSLGNSSAKSTFLWKQKSDFFHEFYWTLTNRALIIWTNNDETCVQGLQS